MASGRWLLSTLHLLLGNIASDLVVAPRCQPLLGLGILLAESLERVGFCVPRLAAQALLEDNDRRGRCEGKLLQVPFGRALLLFEIGQRSQAGVGSPLLLDAVGRRDPLLEQTCPRVDLPYAGRGVLRRPEEG